MSLSSVCIVNLELSTFADGNAYGGVCVCSSLPNDTNAATTSMVHDRYVFFFPHKQMRCSVQSQIVCLSFQKRTIVRKKTQTHTCQAKNK